MTAKNKPATLNQIRSITGLEDDGFITAILELGATPTDVRAAVECLENDELIASYSVNSMVQRICEILQVHQELDDLSERL